MSNYQVKDAGDPRKYYTQVPNIIDDTPMSVYAFRLYVHLKRVAGDDGTCWQGTRKLADACGMSAGKISEAKRELEKLGLITIKTVMNGQAISHQEITIIDVWDNNATKYQTSTPAIEGCSPHEQGCSHSETGCSPHETKNNPDKNNPRMDELLPASPGGRKLFARLDYEARAKGRTGPKKFQTTAQRDRFLEAEAQMTPEQLDAAIGSAMIAGATSRDRVVNYLAACAKPRPRPANGNGRAPQPAARSLIIEGV